jgi:hypothetical protein
MAEHILQFHPAKPKPYGRLEKIGLFLRRNRRLIIGLQWIIVVAYAAMVIIPAFMPIPAESAHIWDNFRLFAQFCFWGLWWPGVMIATVTMGRVWCGFFCPEGAMTEWISKYGRGKALPRWLKWTGWPFVAFICTTVYGQLVSVYEYPEAALLVLGGSTVAALGIGLLYGKEKRIWCRYLCPASGVFAVLAKIAPLHYKVDRDAWDKYQGDFEPVNCAPLLDVRRMTSTSECHSCGRCAGQRDAVTYSARSPFAEILDFNAPAKTPDALTLVYGVLGVATAAFQWTLSPWLLNAKLAAAEWLVEHDHFAAARQRRAMVATHPLPGSQRPVHLARRRADPRLPARRRLPARQPAADRPGPRRQIARNRTPDLATLHPRPDPARRRQRHPRSVDADRDAPQGRTPLARLATLVPHRLAELPAASAACGWLSN